MKFELSDLKTPDALNEYCRRVLGPPQRHRGVMIYPCPFGTHTRFKLQVTEYQGEGRFKCWACDRGGDLFDLHAGMNAQDTQRDFPGILRGVCEILGVRLPDDDGTPIPARRRSGRPRPTPFMAVAPPGETSCFVSAPDEAELDACRERLVLDERLAGELAAELGLSPLMMLVHTDRTLGRGLLGATEDRRLVYLYQANDEAGNTRYTGMKLRRRDNHPNLCLKLETGQWKSHGTMNSTEGNPHGIRFMWSIGKAGAPWGIHSAYGKRFVIVTEGESDCLAIGQALEGFRESYQQDVDPDTRRPYEDRRGSLEAMIPAVVAIPGAGGMKAGWDTLLAGKNVILALDADRAGREAAFKLRERLTAAGCVIRDWMPPYKDARNMLLHDGEHTLYKSIFESMHSFE
ncbi:toprim domain-containing protein [Akkermansia sp.]|uniref:toprim domain-containing protein n=1 Tax=Akkermansia sp. TaxID=1872421 RepID=UPI0025BACFC7|nr:toprim domain-containing protein [Akkermansia sp.]MCC8149650.1 toprim domain-containing protein [Akkermansia sp.]